MDSNFRYTGMHWLRGSNASLTEIESACKKKTYSVEQIWASGFSGLFCASASGGFGVHNSGLALSRHGRKTLGFHLTYCFEV